eukprot:scaffold2006_cov283-Chaetoceros_neogracile.AAC.6
MNKPPYYFKIATSVPPTLETHDEEVELPTITAEAQVVEDVELAVTPAVVASTYVEGQVYTFSRSLPCHEGRSIDVLGTPPAAAEPDANAAFLKVQGVIAIPESLQQSNHNSDYGQQTTSTIKIKLPIKDTTFLNVVFWNGIVILVFFASSMGLLACDPFKSYALDDETVKEIRCKREVGSTGVDLYEVHIAREDGSSDKVLVGLMHVEEALFVAQEIERIMSIQDNEKTKIAGVEYDDDDVEWSLDGLAVA